MGSPELEKGRTDPAEALRKEAAGLIAGAATSVRDLFRFACAAERCLSIVENIRDQVEEAAHKQLRGPQAQHEADPDVSSLRTRDGLPVEIHGTAEPEPDERGLLADLDAAFAHARERLAPFPQCAVLGEEIGRTVIGYLDDVGEYCRRYARPRGQTEMDPDPISPLSAFTTFGATLEQMIHDTRQLLEAEMQTRLGAAIEGMAEQRGPAALASVSARILRLGNEKIISAREAEMLGRICHHFASGSRVLSEDEKDRRTLSSSLCIPAVLVANSQSDPATINAALETLAVGTRSVLLGALAGEDISGIAKAITPGIERLVKADLHALSDLLQMEGPLYQRLYLTTLNELEEALRVVRRIGPDARSVLNEMIAARHVLSTDLCGKVDSASG